jgi:quinol monooxygenase YgiN
MYGTVARMRVKEGMQDRASQLMEEQNARPTAGLLADYAFRTDADPNVYYIVAIFESKESYWANAQSPEQDAQYRALREILEEDPEWNDGEVVYSSEHGM